MKRMKMPRIQNKLCFVPCCKSTIATTPNKIFVSVPPEPSRKKQWFKAARRDTPTSKTVFFCCEDHFNLEEDMVNFVRYKLIGGCITLKVGVVPHIFDCQTDRTKETTVLDRSLPTKLKREPLVDEVTADSNKEDQLNLLSVTNIDESNSNAVVSDSNWEIKLEVEDYNLEDLHHEIDIKDEVPFEMHNEEIQPVHNYQNRKSTKRKLSCSLSEEDIISVVFKKPTLWNLCHNDCGCGKTLSVWQDVAQELGVSGQGLACKAKWDSIREQYINFKQNCENRQDVKGWKYFDRLSFLDPYLSFSQNLEDGKLAAPYTLSAAQQKLNRKLSNDPVTTYFLNIENTFKNLPPDLQIEAKRNIDSVMENYELMVIKRNFNQ